uniref:Uncharacterized protein n=1 Tax=Anopheles darlingi TaxID=43151 RepID=A0A2M4DDB2_ANODA
MFLVRFTFYFYLLIIVKMFVKATTQIVSTLCNRNRSSKAERHVRDAARNCLFHAPGQTLHLFIVGGYCFLLRRKS